MDALLYVAFLDLDSECHEKRVGQGRVETYWVGSTCPHQEIVSYNCFVGAKLEGSDCDLLHTWIYDSTSKGWRLHEQFVASSKTSPILRTARCGFHQIEASVVSTLF